jgi:hypothetical protein
MFVFLNPVTAGSRRQEADGESRVNKDRNARDQRRTTTEFG